MTVPSPSAPSCAVCHLSCPLPSESCHLPACPRSLGSDASGSGPGRGPAPASPSDGPRLVVAGRHGGSRGVSHPQQERNIRLQRRPAAATPERRQHRAGPHGSPRPQKQACGRPGGLSDGGPVNWPSGAEWTAERRECRPSRCWALSERSGCCGPRFLFLPEPPPTFSPLSCPPAQSVRSLAPRSRWWAPPMPALCLGCPPRPSIRRQAEDDDNNTATNTRLLPQCQKPCDLLGALPRQTHSPRGGSAGAPAPRGGPRPRCQTRWAQVLRPFQGALLQEGPLHLRGLPGRSSHSQYPLLFTGRPRHISGSHLSCGESCVAEPQTILTLI